MTHDAPMAEKSPPWIQQEERIDHQLVRGIGVPSLTANIVSSTIGAGIFVIPATVAKGLGSAAPLAFICCAIAMVLFVTCFAIAGSRVSLTGGLYAYVELAFVRYVGFLAGILYFLTALGAVARVGIEVALIPSGEVKNPARTVPRSAYLALVITTILYLMIQLVAQGTLGVDLGNHPDAPLAESAAIFLGNLGRMILLAGASISAFGFVTSDILSSPRMIFAFGRDGALPQFFAHVHPRYRSPDVAITTYAILAFALSVSGTFEKLAVLSNVAVLLMYLFCCASCWVLVQRDVRADGAQPFNFPGMKIVPALAIVAIFWILSHATAWEFEVNGIVLAVASVFYFLRAKLRST